MARLGVTYQQVAVAASELLDSGRQPTLETIRHILGTGSNSTLAQHLRTWRAKQESTSKIATKEHIPEHLVAALKHVWEQVVEQSDARIQIVQEETQQTLSVTQQEFQQLQQNHNLLQQNFQQIKQERDGYAHEKSTLNHLLADAKIELATLTEKLAGSEQQNKEKQARIDELSRQHQQIQTNLEHYREASLAQRLEDQQRFEQQQNQLEKTIQQLNSDIMDIKRNHGVLQQSNQQLLFENTHLKTQFNTIESQHQAQSENVTNTMTQLTKKTQDAERWQEQYQTLQLKHDEQNKTHAELQTHQAVLSQQLSQLHTELKEVRNQNQALAHEKWVLGQEKSQLYGQLKQLSGALI